MLARRGLSSLSSLTQNAHKVWEPVTCEKSYWIKDADIKGKVPKGLIGTYLRNGPGLVEKYGVKLLHPIDGDGLICALTFTEDGKVHFKNRFVETEERQEEETKKQFLYRGQMGSMTEEMIGRDTAQVKEFIKGNKRPRIKFRNPSNTNIWHWNDRLLSTYETSPPYSLHPGTLQTLGKETLGDTLTLNRLGAHFRIDTSDPSNYKMVTQAYVPGITKATRVELNEYSWDLTCTKSNVYKLKTQSYVHDFALLEDFYVIHNSPFSTLSRTETLRILSGGVQPDEMMNFNPSLKSELVFLPREGNEEPIVIETPYPFHMYHFGTCSQQGDEVVLTVTALPEKFNMTWQHRFWLANACTAPGIFTRFNINLKTRKITYEQLDSASNEFPTSHPYRHGHIGTKYNYLMACNEVDKHLPFVDIIKVDADAGQSARKVWRSDGIVSEPIFAPRGGFESSTKGDEDDGWLITQYYHPDTPHTKFMVLDAKRVEDGPVCVISVDLHVPYPFHGTFTPDVFNTPGDLQ